MRQILPTPTDEVDPREILERKSRIGAPGRPWVMANMVMSADGSFASEGTSRGLSSDADRDMFHMLRAAADVVLVAAGTARTERYRRPTTRPSLATFREELGLGPVPQLAVITSSAEFPDDQPFFTGERPDPLIFHPRNFVPSDLPGTVEPCPVGSVQVDLGEVMENLYSRGARVVLCEGGPHLLGQLVKANLVDEFCLTLAPFLIGGAQTGLLGNVTEVNQGLRLHRVIGSGDQLLLNYRSIAAPPD
ncbi:MAG TPA: dihydrofolate reductase family protein [Microthrixaceae bacterium]|nr:dihydrofolate reductase family protein [Microthrixaceae bacterium]